MRSSRGRKVKGPAVRGRFGSRSARGRIVGLVTALCVLPFAGVLALVTPDLTTSRAGRWIGDLHGVAVVVLPERHLRGDWGDS